MFLPWKTKARTLLRVGIDQISYQTLEGNWYTIHYNFAKISVPGLKREQKAKEVRTTPGISKKEEADENKTLSGEDNTLTEN